MIRIVFLILIAIVMGCSDEPGKKVKKEKESPQEKREVLKISVMQSGKIFIDSGEVTLTQIEQRLEQLKSDGGVVWYYREAPQQEPPPVAMKVIDLITKHKLSVMLFAKPDFSDEIDLGDN